MGSQVSRNQLLRKDIATRHLRTALLSKQSASSGNEGRQMADQMPKRARGLRAKRVPGHFAQIWQKGRVCVACGHRDAKVKASSHFGQRNNNDRIRGGGRGHPLIDFTHLGGQSAQVLSTARYLFPFPTQKWAGGESLPS